MMMNLGSLFKLIKLGDRDDLKEDQLKAILKSLGFNLDWENVTFSERLAAFQRVSKIAALPSASVIAFTGNTPDGGEVYSLVVFSKKTVDDQALKH
jgi:hypothetical protein